MKKHAAADADVLSRVKMDLESKADTQFEQNNLFSKAREHRAVARAALRKLFVQAPLARVGGPNLEPELDKTSSVNLSIEQLEQLGLVKRAYQLTPKEKRATLTGTLDKSPSTDESTGWLAQFKGTPLFDKARKLEAMQVRYDLADNAKAQKRQLEQANTPPTPPPDDSHYRAGEALRLKRRELELKRRLMALNDRGGTEKTAEMKAIPSHWEGDGEGLHEAVEMLIGRKKGIPVLATTGSKQKEASGKNCPTMKKKVKKASIAPHVDEWFEKNAHLFRTEAMRRFPELQKVGTTLLPLKKKSTARSGPIPVQASCTGGAA